MEAALVLLSVFSIPPVTAGSAKYAEIAGEAAAARPLMPDKHGFMPWQWTHRKPPGSRGATGTIEHARAKFIDFKNGTVTIKTDRGQVVKIPVEDIGRQQRQWLDAEMASKERKGK